MRQQKRNYERVFGEQSYLRPEDIELEEKKSDDDEEDDYKPYRGEMYESRMALSRTHDDIEKQKFRSAG